MQIADTPLEESFFTAGDNLSAAATTQLKLVAVAEEDRRRGRKALAVTGAILFLTFLLLGLLLPGQPAPPPHAQTDQSATL